MSAHTLTPWFISDHNRTKIVVTIKGNDLFWVVAETGFGPAVMAEANAAYIVECVNSHDQLLAERDALLVATAKLREALAKFTSHYDCEDCWYSCATLTCNEGRKSDVCDCGAQTAIDALSLPTPSVQK